jgi:hypothetical protein
MVRGLCAADSRVGAARVSLGWAPLYLLDIAVTWDCHGDGSTCMYICLPGYQPHVSRTTQQYNQLPSTMQHWSFTYNSTGWVFAGGFWRGLTPASRRPVKKNLVCSMSRRVSRDGYRRIISLGAPTTLTRDFFFRGFAFTTTSLDLAP